MGTGSTLEVGTTMHCINPRLLYLLTLLVITAVSDDCLQPVLDFVDGNGISYYIDMDSVHSTTTSEEGYGDWSGADYLLNSSMYVYLLSSVHCCKCGLNCHRDPVCGKSQCLNSTLADVNFPLLFAKNI